MIAEGFPHLPVPVGAGAIAPAMPDAQHKPGAGSEQHGYQVQLSCLWKYPANDIEQGEGCVKDEEKDIEEGVPHDDDAMRMLK